MHGQHNTRLQVEALEIREVLNAALPLVGTVGGIASNNHGVANAALVSEVIPLRTDECQVGSVAALSDADATCLRTEKTVSAAASQYRLNILLCPDDDPYESASRMRPGSTYFNVHTTDYHLGELASRKSADGETANSGGSTGFVTADAIRIERAETGIGRGTGSDVLVGNDGDDAMPFCDGASNTIMIGEKHIRTGTSAPADGGPT